MSKAKNRSITSLQGDTKFRIKNRQRISEMTDIKPKFPFKIRSDPLKRQMKSELKLFFNTVGPVKEANEESVNNNDGR